MGYYADLRESKKLCDCGHKKGSHYYLALIGDNSGRCLSRGCTCPIYEEE